MTTKYKTRAFIFKKNDRNESDRMFSVFTDDFGRLDIFAKAIRKITSKLRSGMDTFFMSDIEFIQGKNRKTLTDAIMIEKFNNIFQDTEKFKTSRKIVEILDNFIRGEEKDLHLFDLLNEVFYKLNDCNFKVGKSEIVYYYFLWNMFSLLGYSSEVKVCAGCHNKLVPCDIYFSVKEGGVICKKCFPKDVLAQKISSDIVKILRIILLKDCQTLFKLKIDTSTQKLLTQISENAVLAFCPT